MPTELVVGLVALLVVVASVRVVPERATLAVLRLGRFIRTRGPGIVVVILPFVEKAIRINVDRDVPNWRSLSTEQLAQEIERQVTTSGLGV